MNKRKLLKTIKELYPYVVVILIVVLIRTFLVTPARVDGSSMEPTLSNNNLVILNKLDYRLNDIKRFDIVVVKYGNEKLIKRVIGLPGEHIEYIDNILYVDGIVTKETFSHRKTNDFKIETLGRINVPADTYFVVGDNRGHSSDSRVFGPVDKKQILGSVSYRFFPLNKIGRIK